MKVTNLITSIKALVWATAIILNVGVMATVFSSYQGWNAQALAGQVGFAMSVIQSGFYMIPSKVYNEYSESWAIRKSGKR